MLSIYLDIGHVVLEDGGDVDLQADKSAVLAMKVFTIRCIVGGNENV